MQYYSLICSIIRHNYSIKTYQISNSGAFCFQQCQQQLDHYDFLIEFRHEQTRLHHVQVWGLLQRRLNPSYPMPYPWFSQHDSYSIITTHLLMLLLVSSIFSLHKFHRSNQIYYVIESIKGRDHHTEFFYWIAYWLIWLQRNYLFWSTRDPNKRILNGLNLVDVISIRQIIKNPKHGI